MPVFAGYTAAAEASDASIAEEGRARRLSPWARLVAASVFVLVAAAGSLAGLWAATSGSESTSFLAAAEVLRVEIDVGRGSVELLGGGLDEVRVRRTDHSRTTTRPTSCERSRTAFCESLRPAPIS
jgi:hypothetical protein